MNDLLQKILPRRRIQFAPVEEDDDLISVDIRQDVQRYDNQWDLREPIDPQKLDAFWTDALNDLGADKPEDN